MMHPGAHPVDEDLVRRLIAGQFPRWAGLAVERLPPGGTVNETYRLVMAANARHVIREVLGEDPG
ncbi:hypothetical protein [Streptomyces nojiriensis]|uniref:hypothetical protein n=1 Tax=Streptomyces nojiriensis TaxID=66374 RepID=UPI0036D0A76D